MHELPVKDQRLVDGAPREVSVLANCIGYALAEQGVKVTADDTIAAARRAVDQGWARSGKAGECGGITFTVNLSPPPGLSLGDLVHIAAAQRGGPAGAAMRA